MTIWASLGKVRERLGQIASLDWLEGQREAPPLVAERDEAAARAVEEARRVSRRVRRPQVRLIVSDTEDLGDLIRPDKEGR